MRPDQPLQDREARSEIEEALQTYAERHDARDVILYVAHQSDAIGWNELQSKASLPPERLRAKLNRVERFLRRQIVGYHEADTSPSNS